MNLKELLEHLELETVSEFRYFENLAEVMELEEEIEPETLYLLLRDVPQDILSELLDDYFEDTLKGIPDDATDLYTLMTTQHQCFLGLTADDDDARRVFADELYRFRVWYIFDRMASLTDEDGATFPASVSEALALYRVEKMGGDRFQYDYSGCLDYPIDEYAMTFAVDMPRMDAYEDDCCDDDCGCGHDHHDHDCDCGHDHHHHHHDCDCGHDHVHAPVEDDDDSEDILDERGWDTLIHKSLPVIDGEFSDDLPEEEAAELTEEDRAILEELLKDKDFI